MNKSVIWVLIGIIIVSLIGWVGYNYMRYTPTTYVQESQNPDGTTTVTTINTETGTTTPGAAHFAMTEVAQHKDATSCYTVISGKVYDLTLWVNLHPGGRQAILSLCGTDGTQKFMNQHHGAQKQMDILARYYIGNLSQ